jgi:iron complex outermembrane recepter protein
MPSCANVPESDMNPKRKNPSLLRACATVWPLLLASAAYAEAPMLEEIVVTAEKKSESLQNVPVAVTVIGHEALESLKLRSVMDVAAEAPNLQMLGSNGDAQIVLAMRGVAQSDYSPNGTGPVALYLDEVYMGLTPLASGVQLFDMDRVEMLFGPQGTLYGKNATGGAVNLVTTKPQLKGTSGYAEVGVGNYSTLHLAGALDLELNDRLGTRFAFTSTRNDGFVKNLLPNTPNQSQIGEWAARWSFLYKGEGWDGLLAIDKSRTRAHHSGILLAEQSPDGLGFTGYTRAANRLGFWETQSNRVQDKRFDLTGARMTLNVKLGAHTLTSITAYHDADFFIPEDADGSPWKTLEDDFYAKAKQFAQELRLTSEYTGPFGFIAGLYYSHDTIDGATRYRWFADGGDGTQPLPNNCDQDPLYFLGCYYSNSYEQTRSSTAAYVNTTWQLTDSAKLTAGLRYTHDKLAMNDYRGWYGQANNSFGVNVDGPPLTQFASNFLQGASDTQTDSNVSGKVGLDWHVTPATLLYASVSTGYRGSGFNGFAFQLIEFTKAQPEKLRAAEVGFKATLAGGRVRLNGSAFDYDYKNQQFLFFDPATGTQRLLNAGRSKIRGLELQTTAQLGSRVLVNAGVGLLDAVYDELTLGASNLAGNRLPSSPKASASGSVDYDLWSEGATSVKFRYDVNYVAKQYFEPYNVDALAQGGYTLHNARLALDLGDGRHEIGIYGKNLGNKEYAVYSVDLSGWNGRYFFRGQPRTVGADYRYKF